MSSYNNVLPQLWMSLSRDVRTMIVIQFEIPRTGATEIIDSTLICDGYTVYDLQAITKEKMQEYLKSDIDNFAELWELTYKKINEKLHPAPIAVVEEKIINKTEQTNDKNK